MKQKAKTKAELEKELAAAREVISTAINRNAELLFHETQQRKRADRLEKDLGAAKGELDLTRQVAENRRLANERWATQKVERQARETTRKVYVRRWWATPILGLLLVASFPVIFPLCFTCLLMGRFSGDSHPMAVAVDTFWRDLPSWAFESRLIVAREAP
jgi:Fe2+ transport system protein B